ncbi:Rpn family recombination-promoting nuclease/putative transposase [Nannocystaceae bacterium ST9]
MAGLHDSLFKAAFELPENAAALACCSLPSSLRACFDWSTLRARPGSFVDEQLRSRHTDLLFEVDSRAAAERAYVYLLLEHQSRNDPRMPLRVSRYMDRIWACFEQDNPSGPLPPILPIVVSHAPEGWTAPRRFHELFPGELFAHAPELAAHVPSFELVVDDLRRTSDDELGSRALAGFAKAVLWLLRDGRAGSRLLESMPAWVGLLDGLPLRSLTAIVNYLAGITSDPMIWEAFRANLREQAPRAERDVMTLAEQWFQQGEAQGEAKGELKGEAKVLTRQLTSKFGELSEAHRVRLASANVTELDRWADRVLFATSLAQVFDEPVD